MHAENLWFGEAIFSLLLSFLIWPTAARVEVLSCSDASNLAGVRVGSVGWVGGGVD